MIIGADHPVRTEQRANGGHLTDGPTIQEVIRWRRASGCRAGRRHHTV